MNATIKNVLGGVLAVGVLALAYAALSYANSYDQTISPASFRSFSVTSEGKATAIPDVAEFNFQVITEGGNDLSASQTKNTGTTNKALAFLKAQGVADKDIKTQSYNVDPRYQTTNCQIISPLMPSAFGVGSNPATLSQTCPPPAIVGYTITQAVDVKVRDFSKIGAIIGGLVKNGANQVGALSFTVDDPTKIQDQARADAIAKAKAKASSIAAAGGFTVGRLLSIQEGQIYPVYPQALMMGTAAKSLAAEAPTIQPGSQEINVNVTMQYEIK